MSRLPTMFVRLYFSCVAAAALLLAAPAHAQRVEDLRAAVERVQAETGGRILSAETVRIGRGQIHRVKVLTRDGRVRVVTVQGDMLRERGAVLAADRESRADDALADAPPVPPAAPPPPAPELAPPAEQPRIAAPEPPLREPMREAPPERAAPPEFEGAPRGTRGEMPLPALGVGEDTRPAFEPVPSPAFERHDPNLQQHKE